MLGGTREVDRDGVLARRFALTARTACHLAAGTRAEGFPEAEECSQHIGSRGGDDQGDDDVLSGRVHCGILRVSR